MNYLLWAIVMMPCMLLSQQEAWIESSHPKDVPVSKLLLTKTGVLSATYGNGIHISKDDGKTWSKIRSPLLIVTDLIEVDKSTVLVATKQQGLYQLDLPTLSFELDTVGMSEVRSVNDLVQEGKYIYAGTNRGLYSKEISSGSWKKMPLPQWGNSSHIHSVVATTVGVFAGGSNVLFFKDKNRDSNWTMYHTDVPTEIVSLKWAKKQLFVGTSGDGVILFNKANQEWEGVRNVELYTPDNGVIQRLLGDDLELISISGPYGIAKEGTGRMRDVPAEIFAMDYLSKGGVELIATHTHGVLIRSKLNKRDGPITPISRSGSIFPTVSTSVLNIRLNDIPSMRSL
jgi:hypothetical protein